MKSSIDDRVSRMFRAIGQAAGVIPGMMIACQLADPEIGSHFNCTPNSMIGRMPSQNDGIDTPSDSTKAKSASRIVAGSLSVMT